MCVKISMAMSVKCLLKTDDADLLFIVHCKLNYYIIVQNQIPHNLRTNILYYDKILFSEFFSIKPIRKFIIFLLAVMREFCHSLRLETLFMLDLLYRCVCNGQEDKFF